MIFFGSCVDNSGNWGRGGMFDALANLSGSIADAYRQAFECGDLHLGDLHLIKINGQFFYLIFLILWEWLLPLPSPILYFGYGYISLDLLSQKSLSPWITYFLVYFSFCNQNLCIVIWYFFILQFSVSPTFGLEFFMCRGWRWRQNGWKYPSMGSFSCCTII